jgi:hypothetical protein
MRRALAAGALLALLGAATLSQVARTASPAPAPARHADRAPTLMTDPAAIGELRSIAAIGAGQARTLRAAVRRCRPRAAAGQCALVALEHAAAGAKLSEIVLRAVSARLPAGPCMRIAARLAGLVSTIGYLARDGVRSRTWPGYTWGAASASARVGARVIAVHEGSWPRHCLSIRVGLRA